MSVFRYRLQPLLDQRIRLKEEAAENLSNKKQQLRAAAEKLIELERQEQTLARKKIELRRDMLAVTGAAGLAGTEVQRRSDYLAAVGHDLEAARDAVFAQKMFIEDCERAVREAQEVLAKRSRDVEVLQKHHDTLRERFLRDLERKEMLELDEIGNMMHRRSQQ